MLALFTFLLDAQNRLLVKRTKDKKPTLLIGRDGGTPLTTDRPVTVLTFSRRGLISLRKDSFAGGLPPESSTRHARKIDTIRRIVRRGT